MDMQRSPLAPDAFPGLAPVAGVRLRAGSAGVRYKGRTDVLFAEMDPGTTVAGTLTRSACPSAPVDWCRRALDGGTARALVVNSGNANAFTGRAGDDAVRRTTAAAAELVGCAETEVFAASTGVIGELLPAERIVNALPSLAAQPDGGWEAAARAIMTTDTFPKGASRHLTIGGRDVTLTGIAKGSGMIAPDMATMLAFVFTDAAVAAPVLKAALGPAVDRSFNSITVDSDTSTSDTTLVFATGKAGNRSLDAAEGPDYDAFAQALEGVCADLARQIVRDGEGATKFVAVTVSGAASDAAARRIGLAVANSPLVKTAVAGQDPNWGRIVAAVGKAGEKADRDRLAIAIGGHAVARDGAAVAGYDEAPVAAHMKGEEIDIAIDVGVGDGRATVWTCDLTHRYIDINADYRS